MSKNENIAPDSKMETEESKVEQPARSPEGRDNDPAQDAQTETFRSALMIDL